MTAKSKPATVRVRAPDRQSPFVIVNGAPYVSLLWSYGDEVEVPVAELAALLAGTRGSIIIARRLIGAERRLFESERHVSDVNVHASIVIHERVRWRRAR